MTSVYQRIAIVTGANSGIGVEIARELAVKHQQKVIMACRTKKTALKAKDSIEASIRDKSSKGSVEYMPLDLGDFASIRSFAKSFKAEHEILDLLMLNAGIATASYKKTVHDLEMCFGINAVGNAYLTKLLSDCLVKSESARIVAVTGDIYKIGHAIEFDDSDQYKQMTKKQWAFTDVAKCYATSKTALNLWAVEEARRLKKHPNVTMTLVHPGVIKTNLMRDSAFARFMSPVFGLFAMTVKQGAVAPLYCGTDPSLEGMSGDYYYLKKKTPLAAFSCDPEVAKKMWKSIRNTITCIEQDLE